MSTYSETATKHAAPDHELPLPRWLGLVVLLATEMVLFTVLFEPLFFAQDRSWVSHVMRQLRDAPQVAVVIAVALGAFGGHWMKSERTWLANELVRPHRPGFFLICHLVAFAILLGFSAWVFDKSVPAGGLRLDKLMAWCVAGVVTLFLWGQAALPLAVWLRMVRHGAGVLVVSALVAAASLGMGRVTQTLWPLLGRSTFWLVRHLLALVFSDVISDPARQTIGTSTFVVWIAPGCSGFEGIGLIWVLLLGSFWIFKDRFQFPRVLLLVPIGTALIWVSNSVRIAALVAFGTSVSPQIAIGGFHSYTGWLAFNLIGLGLLTAALRCRYFLVQAVTAEEQTGPSPTAAYLMPLLLIVATMMVTGALSEGFDRLYPLRVVVAAVILWWYRKAYGELRLSWSWEGIGIGVAVFALWMGLEPNGSFAADGLSPWAVYSPGFAVAWLIMRVLGSVVLVPLAEELAFRGYLLRRVVAADFRTVTPGRLGVAAVAISSAAFGALHGRWLAGTLAGALYTLAYCRRGKLGDAVLAHATTNALIAAEVIAMGTWSLWS